MTQHKHVGDALAILRELGLPKAQQNERSALCLLALLDVTPERTWSSAGSPLLGITPIMDWAREHYGKDYAPNTRETVRRQTVHQFVQAGLAVYNPDEPSRPVNSPKAVYQVGPEALALLRTYGTSQWAKALESYRATHKGLADQYAAYRSVGTVPVQIREQAAVVLTPGEHSQLIRAVVEQFAPRFAPGSTLIYVGDTGNKWGYFDHQSLDGLGVVLDSHGKMPDVVLYSGDRKWLFLVEAVTSHGPVDAKRHRELTTLFSAASVALVFVTAFPNRATMTRFLSGIAWETEVWVADAPDHLIHFDGKRFLGPYPSGNHS